MVETRLVTQDNIYESIRLSRNSDLLYLCNYKAACTTILLTLARGEMKAGFIDYMPDEHQVHVDKIFFIDDFNIVDECPLIFSFVKNPYARVLSAYLDKIWRRNDELRLAFCRRYGLDAAVEVSFYQFLCCLREEPAAKQDVHWRPQAHNLLLGGLAIDLVGHVEHFAADFSVLAGMSGLSLDPGSVRAGRAHATEAQSRTAEFYTAREIALVDEMYEEDFLAFGYRFDPGDTAPQRRHLTFAVTDKALNHFIRGVGLCRTHPQRALIELRAASALSGDNPHIAKTIAAAQKAARP